MSYMYVCMYMYVCNMGLFHFVFEIFYAQLDTINVAYKHMHIFSA
jgi:hypothetical protein